MVKATMRIILFIAVSILLSFTAACDVTDDYSYYSIEVNSRGDGFYGTYWVDDDDGVNFFVYKSEDDDNIRWVYTKDLSDPQSITIEVYGFEEGVKVGNDYTPVNTTTSISIHVKEDDSIAETFNASKTEDVALTLFSEYTFTTDDSTDTTTE